VNITLLFCFEYKVTIIWGKWQKINFIFEISVYRNTFFVYFCLWSLRYLCYW